MKLFLFADASPGSIGGGESVANGLIESLSSKLSKTDQIKVVISEKQVQQFGNKKDNKIQFVQRLNSRKGLARLKEQIPRPAGKLIGKIIRAILNKKEQGLPEKIPPPDPWLESQKPDVVHFLFPHEVTQTSAKTVCTVHDLQHEHLPEFFSADHIAYRRKIYSHIASECDAIPVISAFSRGDFLEKYPIGIHRTHLISWPAYASQSRTTSGGELLHGIPPEFILYPAYSYGHKNHLGLLRALSLAQRKHKIRMPLVCTGGRSAFWQNVLAEMKHLSPRPEMIDVGYLEKEKLEFLYQRCKAIVFPSLFEGMGLPLVEAFTFHKPVACSDIPPFREFGGEAPEFFDPKNPESMADCLARIWKGGGKPIEIIRSLIPKAPITSWGECASRYAEIYQRVHRSKKRISGEP